MIIIRKTQFSGEDQIALVVLISMIYILKQLGNKYLHYEIPIIMMFWDLTANCCFFGAEIIASILAKFYNASLTIIR